MLHSIKISIGRVAAACAVLSLVVASCQKKFDANSYKPVESFGGYGASNEIAPDNLVAHFSFESTLLDSVSGTSATGYGTSYASSGLKGAALTVDSGNYAIFPATTALHGLQSATVAFWVNASYNANATQEMICFVDSTQFWGNLDLYFDGQSSTGASFRVHAFGSAGAKEVFLTNWTLTSPWDSWKHMAVTYDSTTTTFAYYLNGALVGSSVQTGFGGLNFANFPSIVLGTWQFATDPSQTSGGSAQSWAGSLIGSMDELRIYNKALSASDVKALYQLENYGK